MTVRPWNRETDADLCAEWWRAHTGTAFQVNMLPPLGVMAEDEAGPIAACWLHLSLGIGVCFLEMPVSRPGLSLKQAREAFAAVRGALEAAALAHDYGVMIVHTPAAIARTLARDGFHFAEKPVLTGTKLLRHGN